MKNIKSDSLRNLIFGAEDSLVSTFGVLFGITSVAGFTKTQILIAGLVTIVVEATSMGAGSFLSETSTNELEGEQKHNPISDGIIMFVSYFFAGFIPLAPYAFFELHEARYFSIAASLTALFILGCLPTKKFKSGLRMMLVAGIAAALGYLVAHIFSV
jgi:VIT1/CCC1 family predicted Fe2+/Mn2+ transporter